MVSNEETKEQHMNTNLLNVVKRIAAEHGEGILGDPQRLKAFFGDLAKDEPKALRVAFGRCIEAGAYTALKTAPNQSERAERKAAIAQRVRDEQGLDIALCVEALDILEAALFGVPSAIPPQAQAEYQERPQSPTDTMSVPAYTVPIAPPPVYAYVNQENVVTPATAKKHTLRNVLIVMAAIVFAPVVIVTIVILMMKATSGNSAGQAVIPTSQDSQGQYETLDWYQSIGPIRIRSSDPVPAAITVEPILGYTQADKTTQTELTSRQIEIKDFFRRYFSEKTAADLRPQNEEKIRKEILNSINNNILTSSKIRDVKFLTFDIIE
jgi:flagellar FliL protein